MQEETQVSQESQEIQELSPEEQQQAMEGISPTIYTAHWFNLQCNPTTDRQPSTFPETPL